MGTREQIHSDLAVPPGEFLAEVLEDLDMSQADLARRMGRPAQAINEIVKGLKALTPETAIQLEQVVRVPAHIWMGLEAEYRLLGAREADAQQVRRETELLDAFPYKEMVRTCTISGARRAEDKVRELRKFFGVASLYQLGDVPAYAPAFRLGAGAREPSAYGLAAWLHCGYMQARHVETAPFDSTKLRGLLPSLRALTSTSAEAIPRILRDRLAECGVVFALFPHFPKTYAQGATFWITPRTKAVVLSSIRGKWADIFWFSLFHELGHLLLHGNTTFIEIDRANRDRGLEEGQADAFARDMLIPPTDYARLASENHQTVQAIHDFATSIGVHPGIVVGRLQHDRLLLPSYHNELRQRYELRAGDESAA